MVFEDQYHFAKFLEPHKRNLFQAQYAESVKERQIQERRECVERLFHM